MISRGEVTCALQCCQRRVVPELAANERVPALLFMPNNPIESAERAAALGAERVVLGFAGAGGTRNRSIVHHEVITQQPATSGELNGEVTTRLKARASMFANRDFLPSCLAA